MDARSAIAMLSLTNRLEDGPLPVEVKVAFEQENPGFIIEGEIYEVQTNGLFRVDLWVGGVSGGFLKTATTVTNSVLLYRPMSQQPVRSSIIRRR
jgi:hypothetical protein